MADIPTDTQPATNFMRSLAKEKGYQGWMQDAARSGYFRRLPTLSKLTTVQNTSRACSTCRGTRFISIQHITGQLTLEPCNMCEKSGIVFG